ncbi:MAG: DNA polymerase III subunit beta [Acutalibacteraceae bacterium]
MKVLCQGTELSDALAKVTKALPFKRSNPILDGVKLTAAGDTLTLFATDTELAIEKKINAEVLIEGECVIPGKLFADYAKKIEDEQLELDATGENKLVIRYLDSDVSIKGFDADDYPVFKEVAKERSFIILKKNLKELINKIIFNVATDEARPSLRGCCLNIKKDEVEGVASDGYRLALSRMPIKNNGIEESIVVPAKSLMELSRLIDDEDESMTVYVDNNFVMVDLFHTKIVTRLIAESYISYSKIIPSAFNTEVTIDKKIFENAIDRVSLINRNSKRYCVKFDIKEDCMNLSAESEDGTINERVPISLKGKDLIAGFNSKFVMECMKAIDDEYITFNLTTSTAPVIIKGNSDSWLYLILPLRVIV